MLYLLKIFYQQYIQTLIINNYFMNRGDKYGIYN